LNPFQNSKTFSFSLPSFLPFGPISVEAHRSKFVDAPWTSWLRPRSRLQFRPSVAQPQPPAPLHLAPMPQLLTSGPHPSSPTSRRVGTRLESPGYARPRRLLGAVCTPRHHTQPL
jgi:hypothetical protein